jgi:single-stranded DNA-binding protein
VESRLKSCTYTTKDGQTHSSLEVTVSDVYFLGGKGADGHHSVKEVAQTVSIDDLPIRGGYH